MKESEKAKRFAQMYVRLVEALMQEGVAETQARIEARAASVTYLLSLDEQDQVSCPLCGAEH